MIGTTGPFLLLTAAIIGLALPANAGAPARPQPDPRHRLSDAERADCIARGGHTATLGMLNGEGCVLPMPDAGKICTDGSQCKGGSCLLDDGKPGFKPPKPGRLVKGQCAATDYGFGCAWRVNKGRANGMCVD